MFRHPLGLTIPASHKALPALWAGKIAQAKGVAFSLKLAPGETVMPPGVRSSMIMTVLP